MQTQQTITLFGTVSNSATSRISKNGRKYTAFGVAIIPDRNLRATGSFGCTGDCDRDIGGMRLSKH
jgi:hypothetical protein